MAHYIYPASSSIEVVADNSFVLNNALYVNAVISASGVVASGTAVAEIVLPKCGAKAEIGYFNPASDHAPTAAATVKCNTAEDTGLPQITITLGAATAASQEYVITGWMELG